jgi:hypothetical protein
LSNKPVYVAKSSALVCFIASYVGRFHVPLHAKVRARSASRVQKIVSLNDQGLTNEEIAQRLNCSTKTIQRGLARYVEVDSKYAVGPEATDVLRRRSESLHKLDEAERQLELVLSNLDEPENLADQLAIVQARVQSITALCKIVEQRAKLSGAYAPVAKDNVVNNTLVNMGASEEDQVRALIAYRQLQNGRK